MANSLENLIKSFLSNLQVPNSNINLDSDDVLESFKVKDDTLFLFFKNVAPDLQENLKETVLSYLTKHISQIQKVQIGFTAHAPQKQASSTIKAPLDEQHNGLTNIKSIIAVASGKGGVGKSTTAFNLAQAFKLLGKKVGILDADIYGPSLPTLLNIHKKPDVNEHKKIIPLEINGIKAMSIGFLIDTNTAMIWRGPMVHGALKQLLLDVAWGDLDVLIVDMPPGTGDAQLTLVQQAKLKGAVIVTTPQDLALIDAHKGVLMFQRVGVPVLGIIENMSYLTCPHCTQEIDIFHKGGAQSKAISLNIPFLGAIPLDLNIRASTDAGEFWILNNPYHPMTEKYINITKSLID